MRKFIAIPKGLHDRLNAIMEHKNKDTPTVRDIDSLIAPVMDEDMKVPITDRQQWNIEYRSGGARIQTSIKAERLMFIKDLVTSGIIVHIDTYFSWLTGYLEKDMKEIV